MGLTEELQEMLNNMCISINDALPDMDEFSRWKMFTERMLFLDLYVDANVLTLERMILAFNMEDKDKPVEERKPIKLFLQNDGGLLQMAYSLIDIIQASKTPVYTYDLGVCSSAAALIFLSAPRRFMFRNSTVLIHQGSAEFTGDAGKILDATQSYKEMLKKMNNYILQRTNIPKAMLTKKRNDDWTLSAEECIKYQVATDIVENLEDII